MLGAALAQAGTGHHTSDPHLAHVKLHRFAIHSEIWLMGHYDLSRTVERMRRVDFINPMLECDFGCGRWRRLVIQPRSIQAQQVRLGGQGQRAYRTALNQH